MMANESLYVGMSSFDPDAPWPKSQQKDIRDNRNPEPLGQMIQKARGNRRLRKLATHELHDILEQGRA